jgi:hypothetical protein
MGTIAAFGDFWTRRASVGLAVAREAGGLTIRLDRPRAALGPDLALGVAGGEASEGLRVLDRDGARVPHRVTARSGQRVVALEPQN